MGSPISRQTTGPSVTAWASLVTTCVVAAGCAPREHHFLDRLPEPIVYTRIPGPPAAVRPPATGFSPVYPQAGWVPLGGTQDRWRCIVVHHSANDRDNPTGIDQYHRQRGWDEMGYHFVIGNGVSYPDGKVYVGPRWSKQKHGAHCKTPGNYYNEHGVGICLIGNFEHTRPTPGQMQSLAGLCRFLCAACDIPESQILTHGGITGQTLCPGRHFSLAQLHRRLNRTVMATSTE